MPKIDDYKILLSKYVNIFKYWFSRNFLKIALFDWIMSNRWLLIIVGIHFCNHQILFAI